MKRAGKKKIVKASTWYERIFDSFDFADIAKSDELDMEKEPQWVVNTFRELAQQIMPALPFRSANPVTPRVVGRYLGHSIVFGGLRPYIPA
jgi:hypothetical protein